MSDGEKPLALKDLDARLKSAKARHQPAKRATVGGGMGIAMHVAIDLVAGVAVGVAVGIGLDRWLGTGPWLLILFFILGAAAGFVNVYRTAQRMQAAALKESTAGKTDKP